MTSFEKLLVAHLVGDWILAQTDWEAQNKGKEWGAAAFHGFKWSLCMLFGVFWACGGATPKIGLLVLLMGALHAIIDRRWPTLLVMHFKEYIPFGYPLMGGERREPPFWLVICIDQVLHVVQVAIIASAL